MAVSTQIIRVKNPRRRRRNMTAHRVFRNKKGRFVKLSRVKAIRKMHKAKRAKRRNPKTLKVKYTRNSRRAPATRRRARRSRKARRRVRNPIPVLIELGAVNPRRRKHVARKRRKARRNPRRRRVAAVRVNRRRHHRRRRNPGPPAWAVAKGYRRRRANPRRRRARRHYGRRRNPAIFGRSSGKDLLVMVGGGLVGVAATKYLPTLLPTSITAGLGGGAIMSVLMTGAGAFVAGWLAGKVNSEFGQAVLFGGLMQTGSAALNAFAPPSIAGRLALSGVGDIMATGPFPVPNNQFKSLAMPAPINAGMSGFRTAFGGRR